MRWKTGWLYDGAEVRRMQNMAFMQYDGHFRLVVP